MGGTEFVKSRFIVLNDDRDSLQYQFAGQAAKAFVTQPTGGAEDIDVNVVGGAAFVQGATAEEKREVARQAVMALMEGLDDDELVAELAYLFQYEDASSTETLLVDTPKRFTAKLREALKELRSASNLDGVTVAAGDDVYANIPHNA